MTWKQMLLTGGWSEHYRRHVRPAWQIVALLPLAIAYIPARRFVDWMDGI